MSLRIFILLVIWGAPAVLFTFGAPDYLLQLSGCFAWAICIIWAYRLLLIIPASIPFAAIFGPLVKFNIASMNFMLADLYLLSSLVLAFLRGNFLNYRTSRTPLYSLRVPVVTTLFVSVLLSLDISVSLIALTQLVFLFCVYSFTLKYINTEAEVAFVINCWVVATALASIVTLYFYSQGIYLLDIYNQGNTYFNNEANYFFRATYIYTGFHFLVGASLLAVLVNIYSYRTRFELLFYSIVFFVLMVTLVLVNIKSSIYSILFVGVVFLSFKVFVKRAVYKIITISAVSIIVFSYFDFLVSGEQFNLLYQRFATGDSLDHRFEIYDNVFMYLFENPLSFLFGVGPAITSRFETTMIPELSKVFTGSSGTVGAIDSTYVTVLFEYGAILFIFFIYIIFQSFYRLVKVSRFTTESAFSEVQLILVFWVISASTQVTGISKSAWFIVQIVAMAHCAVRYSNLSHRGSSLVHNSL